MDCKYSIQATDYSLPPQNPWFEIQEGLLMACGRLKEHITIWNIFCGKYLIAIAEIHLQEEKSHFVLHLTVSLYNQIHPFPMTFK